MVLNSLISGPFDVDRADYIRRDSDNCGVEYGTFDFSWLVHSMRIDINQNQEPYLSFDGPRGIEALRQFLGARRHMYRHVYLHPTIRAAQVLLRGIFQRLFEIEDLKSVIEYIPQEFLFLQEKRRLSIDEFIRISDTNIHVFIQTVLSRSTDSTLACLAQFFSKRNFPKTIVDSTKLHYPVREHLRISNILSRSELIQADLFADTESTIGEFLDSLREFATFKLQNIGIPSEISKYVIAYDRCDYVSQIPDTYRFHFGNSYLKPSELTEATVGFKMDNISESFTIERFYGPASISDALRDFVSSRYVRKPNGLPGR
jgi:uncharacterized protein